MRRRAVVAAICVGVLLPVAGAQGATKDVAVKDNRFDPETVEVRIGDSVHWTDSAAARHNVREDHRLFRSGALTTKVDYKVAFSAGTFHYYCENHGAKTGGMDALVKVPVKLAAAPSGLPFTVQWATSASKTGSKYDVQYRIGTAAWKDWKTNATLLKSVFGQGNEPIVVLDGKTYSFRARSQGKDGASRWSPIRSFKP